MLKTLLISPSFYPATYYGGPIFSLYNFALCLAKNGYEVFVSTTNANGKKKLDVDTNKYIELEKNVNVKYYGNGTSHGFSVWMFLMLWQDIIAKDIIYLVSIFSPPTPLVLFLNIFFRKPLILSPRGQLGDWCLKQGNMFKKAWLRLFISPVSNKVTWEATSFSEKEMIKKVYPKAKVEVIPLIIDVNEFSVQGPMNDYTIYEKLTGKNLEGKNIIVSMGRLHKVKGFDILIEVMSIVQDKDTVLLIAGQDFGEQRNLEDIIDRFKLKNKVFLVGNIEGKDKIEFLRNADVFALASHHENFGIVYAEALAAGIPVIASQNTPWQDVEKHNCGLWVENIPDKIAEGISEILNSDTFQMGKNGKKYIDVNFSCSVVVERFSQMIKKIFVNIN